MSKVLGSAIHQAYVFPDFEAALERFGALGIGPFYILHSENSVARFRGEDHSLSMSVAFVYSGDACFEIITPHGDQQSAYGEFLRRNPAGGLHHIAYFSHDFQATLAALEAEGRAVDVVQEFPGPSGEIIEIYCEPVGIENPIQFQLIKPGLFDTWFDAMRKVAASWDGTDPIRDARPLMAAAMSRSKVTE